MNVFLERLVEMKNDAEECWANPTLFLYLCLGWQPSPFTKSPSPRSQVHPSATAKGPCPCHLGREGGASLNDARHFARSRSSNASRADTVIRFAAVSDNMSAPTLPLRRCTG